METIMNYLDNMFINFPQTPEVLKAKENLTEMMEDKYNELIEEGKMVNEAIGIVISEFGNIKELADELGIHAVEYETDEKKQEKEYNENRKLKIEIEGKEKEQNDAENSDRRNERYETGHQENGYDTEYKNNFNSKTKGMRHLSDVEAEEYLFTIKQASGKIAGGVFLCICSPILLLLLGGISSSVQSVSDEIVMGVGLPALLIMIACAVGLFISSGMKLDTYDYLKKECFTIDYEYEQTIRNIRESRKGMFTIKIIIGVIMCILSFLPLLVLDFIFNTNDIAQVIGVAILLITIGIAVMLFISAGMEEDAYNVILQEKDYSVKKKKNKIENIVSSLFWPVICIIYLGWSFISGRWDITWLIWPFSGILYNIIC